MKKILCMILALCLTVCFAGCKQNHSDPTVHSSGSNANPTQETSNNATLTEEDDTMIAVSVPTVTENTVAEDGTVLFAYTYQHMSLVLNKPEVADKVILEFLNRVDSTRETAETTAAMAKTAYTGSQNWRPYLYHITYSPTRIDHTVLSLFGNNVVFSGATHPERTCVSASYDLKTGDVLTLASIMDMDASVGDFCELVLAGLSEMAEGDYLYENYKQTVQHRFDKDASSDEAWYFTQTGLCFYFAPYEIAPYASGVITVEIPYDKLDGLLHKDYLPVARKTAQGSVTITPFDQVDLEKIAHNAEIILDRDGKMYMVQSDGYLQDIRLMLTDDAANYTVFAAYHLVRGDGVMVQANDDMLERMKLSYKTGNETVTKPLV